MVRSGGGSKPLAAKPLCVACQVSRESAARPAVSAPAPTLAASVVPLLAASASDFHARHPAVIFGRAPPLS